MKLTLVDYGAGNITSVERALRRLGIPSERAADAAALEKAEAIVLPGVGHFAALVGVLRQRSMFGVLRSKIQAGRPYLGICVGLQALFESSSEAPEEKGLGLLKGTVESLPPGVKMPHMGWDQMTSVRPTRLLKDVTEDAWVYFAHSYAAFGAEDSATFTCDYGKPFVAAVERDNVFGVQFHPEKSAESGARVLQNFWDCVR